jgi:hypothetical protein
MPGTRYSVSTTAVAPSSRRSGWHECGIGLVDDRGRLVVRISVGGVSLAEVERVARHVAAALEQLPEEPPVQPTRLHRTS